MVPVSFSIHPTVLAHTGETDPQQDPVRFMKAKKIKRLLKALVAQQNARIRLDGQGSRALHLRGHIDRAHAHDERGVRFDDPVCSAAQRTGYAL